MSREFCDRGRHRLELLFIIATVRVMIWTDFEVVRLQGGPTR